MFIGYNLRNFLFLNMNRRSGHFNKIANVARHLHTGVGVITHYLPP